MGRKRLLWLLTAAALLAALLSAPAAAADLTFVAVDDTIPITLTGSEQPFYSSGALYVPYTVFSQSSMGFYPSYIPGSGTLTLFSRSQRLVYDLNTGLVSDEDHQSRYLPTVVRGGTIFLPAAFTASHFGVQVSVLTSRDGYTVVRFTTGAQVYDDSLFIEKAENLIAHLVEQQTTETIPEEVGPSTPADPADPAPAPQPEEPERTPAEVYLAVVDAGTMEQALTALAGQGQTAAFFFTAEEIAAHGDLVRRVAAAGHTVAIAAEGDDAAASLLAANEALDLAMGGKTLLALVPEAQITDALEAQYTVIPRPEQRLTASEAAEAYDQTCLLISDGEQLTAGLAILADAQVTFSPLRETTVLP